MRVLHAVLGCAGMSCRWLNQLNPDVKKGPFTPEEDAAVMAAHNIFGNKWASIAKLLPGRCAGMACMQEEEHVLECSRASCQQARLYAVQRVVLLITRLRAMLLVRAAPIGSHRFLQFAPVWYFQCAFF